MERSFPHPDLTGYVLAGGASSRMGQDKALLAINGRMLVEIAVSTLREVCCEVAILSGGQSTAERTAVLQAVARTVPETGRYLGPVAGIAAAVADARTPWVLVIAVDQPFLPSVLLQEWFDSAVASTAPVSCMILGSVLHPVPVLLQSRLAPEIARCLHEGERRVRVVLDAATASVGASAVHRFPVEETGLTGDWFRNLNAPADLP